MKTSLLVLAFIQYFILIMLLIGSYFEIEKLLLIYKEKRNIVLLENLRSLFTPLFAAYYLVFVVKEVFNKKNIKRR